MHSGRAPEGAPTRIYPIIDIPVEPPEDGPVALMRSVIAAVWMHRFKLALWITFCIVAAALYARTIPATYVAAATLLLEPRRQVAMSGREALAPPTLDLNRADSELQVIRSERLLAQVFDSLDLADHAELRPQPPGAVRAQLIRVQRFFADALGTIGLVSPTRGESQPPRGAEQPQARTEASPAPVPAPPIVDDARQVAFANFSQRIAARRVGQSYVVEISYASSDPVLAARVANAAVSAYLLQSVAFKADAARSGTEFVQGRVDALSAQASAAAAAVKAGTLPDSPTPDADARVIGAALKPLSPSAPRSGLIVALGGVLGLMTGFFAVVVANVFDRRIRTAEDLTRETGLPCLATVPAASHWNGLSRRDEAEMDNFVLTQPDGAFTAAIGNLRTAIKLACPSERIAENHVIALVSWAPNSGCSLLCMNLARLIQRIGKKVTVIDADVRAAKRSLTDLEPHWDGTLVEALSNNTPVAQIGFLDLGGISLLPARPAASRSNYFVDFGDPKVTRILDFVRSKGDVLLDLPPLSDSADASAVARRADAVVIVVAAGRTTVDELKEAHRVLQGVGANVIGAVINAAPSAPHQRA